LLHSGARAAGAAISHNPTLVGGATAFLVTFFFVSANALWYQPFAHKNAFFTTRHIVGDPSAFTGDEGAVPETETIILIDRAAQPEGDPLVEKVQHALIRLDLYAGPVDGIAGTQTVKAVQEYQRILGITATGEIDERLLKQMEGGPATKPAVPVPAPASAPRGRTAAAAVSPETVAATPKPQTDPRIAKIQAGLKAFGNDGIAVDGIMGSKTRTAIREFQSLFGLPETGEIDDALYTKMQEVGLTN
jgi:peptidoglycan hydrolase-like protein with peptidoglycan-binding domain